MCFELKRQYPNMDVTLFELEGVVKIFNEHFLPGNEKLGVKVTAGWFYLLQNIRSWRYSSVSCIIEEFKP